MSVRGYAWVLTEQGRPLVKQDREWSDPPDGFALLEVVGCGVCHTDLGFADGPVRPKQELPIVLGHEIVGRVLQVAGDDALVGRRVLAPAVSPCGQCPTCLRGRPTSCPKGRMPGNDGDGGFATHCMVPLGDVVALDASAHETGPVGSAGLPAWQIAPIADAGTTAYQAIVRAGLKKGDVAIFVGTGGVGGFGVQLARAEGAHVVAIDVDADRLDTFEPYADRLVSPRGRSTRDVRDEVRGWIKEKGLRGVPVRVFETSGHPAGQDLAFTLMERGGSLSVVGFTPEKVQLRLSNIMALDADVFGNWGCDPALYPALVERVLDGRVKVGPFVERHGLDEVNEVLGAMREHTLRKRAVLTPEGEK